MDAWREEVETEHLRPIQRKCQLDPEEIAKYKAYKFMASPSFPCFEFPFRCALYGSTGNIHYWYPIYF